MAECPSFGQGEEDGEWIEEVSLFVCLLFVWKGAPLGKFIYYEHHAYASWHVLGTIFRFTTTLGQADGEGYEKGKEKKEDKNLNEEKEMEEKTRRSHPKAQEFQWPWTPLKEVGGSGRPNGFCFPLTWTGMWVYGRSPNGLADRTGLKSHVHVKHSVCFHICIFILKTCCLF